MTAWSLRLTEARSGLDVTIELLEKKAPANVAFLRNLLAEPCEMPAIHAIWTGPEISCPIPSALVPPELAEVPLPPENATLTPQPGDLVLAYVPARMWGGSPSPIFDLGVFYGPGARMLFPIGWLAGSVIGKVLPQDLAALTEGCIAIRQQGACTLRFEAK